MLKSTAFFNSVELPTTAPSPIIAFPRINAQWRTSASLPMMTGPLMQAVGATLALLAIHTSSDGWSYSSSLKVCPSFRMKSPISGNTSHGYVFLQINPLRLFRSDPEGLKL